MRPSSWASSSTFLARGVSPISSPLFKSPGTTIFSTSLRTLSRFTPKACSALAAIPSPSLSSPKRRCSVPTAGCPRRRASSRARNSTFCALSVNLPNIHKTSFQILDNDFLIISALLKSRLKASISLPAILRI